MLFYWLYCVKIPFVVNFAVWFSVLVLQATISWNQISIMKLMERYRKMCICLGKRVEGCTKFPEAYNQG